MEENAYKEQEVVKEPIHVPSTAGKESEVFFNNESAIFAVNQDPDMTPTGAGSDSRYATADANTLKKMQETIDNTEDHEKQKKLEQILSNPSLDAGHVDLSVSAGAQADDPNRRPSNISNAELYRKMQYTPQ